MILHPVSILSSLLMTCAACCSAQYFHPQWWQDYALNNIDCDNLTSVTSAQPFICHDTFYDYCNVIFSSTAELQTFVGIKIFLYATDVAAFSQASINIEHPFILVTRSNWDEIVPYQDSSHEDELFSAYTAILEHPKLVRWFASNVVIQHPKLVGMPLGPKWQWHTQQMHGEDDTKGALLQVLAHHALDINKNFYSQHKTALMFTSMSEHSSDGAAWAPWRGNRRIAMTALQKAFPQTHGRKSNTDHQDWVSVGDCDVRRSSEAYLLELQQYRFVLSPPGNGPDCHRTWEALLMGCIPVVITGPLNSLYENLPVLILDSWDDLTATRLAATYKSFRYGRKVYAFERLFSPYWLALIDLAVDEASAQS